jgi:hypothetical protein
MQIIMRALTPRCRPAAPRGGAPIVAVADIDCSDLATTERLFANGAGDFSLWRAHARVIFAKYGSIIRPGREDFTQVSELIVRGCTGLLSGGAAADKCFKKDDVNRGLIFGEEAARRASTPQTVAID